MTLPGWDEKFSALGRKHEYDAVYNQLCCDSHSNFRAIIDRHFALDANDTYAQQLLIDTSLAVHRYFNSESVKKLEEMEVMIRGSR